MQVFKVFMGLKLLKNIDQHICNHMQMQNLSQSLFYLWGKFMITLIVKIVENVAVCIVTNLNSWRTRRLSQALDSYLYSCDAPIFLDDHYLKEVVFVHTWISCDSPIEISLWKKIIQYLCNICSSLCRNHTIFAVFWIKMAMPIL
jgi:hypothetical protein